MSSCSSYSSADDNILKGELLNNKYLLIHKIGEGSFASVWFSVNIVNSKYYAVKVQNPEDFENGVDEIDLLKRFSQEKCKFINSLIEHFVYEREDGVSICMVFELMIGSVYDVMKNGKYIEGFPLKTVKTIIYQLLIGMDIINRKHKILHTDIKPENILVVGKNIKTEKMICELNKKSNYTNIFKKKGKFKPNQLKEIIEQINFDSFENTSDIVDDKCIENIHIKLSDFGNCRDITYNRTNIQTRYYRSPEILLDYKYNANCDIWSVGCMVYELITGKLLFNPDKQRRLSYDRFHIHEIISKLGKIPDHLIKTSKRYSDYFKKNGLLKGFNEINYSPLYITIIEKLDNRVPKDQIFTTLDFIYKLLDYDPFKRPTPQQALQHKWFDDL